MERRWMTVTVHHPNRIQTSVRMLRMKINRIVMTQKARDIIPCGECGKPRLVYSQSKLVHEQVIFCVKGKINFYGT
jgi:hypothetical protein